MNFRNNRYDGTKLGLTSQADTVSGLQLQPIPFASKPIWMPRYRPRSGENSMGFDRPNLITMPCGYRARPLVGVWATAPFLHNGSVPTIFDLLSESRPTRVRLGGTEYDPVKLGLSQDNAPNTFMLDTKLVGNSNAGHWFTDDLARKGRIGRRLTDEEKYDLIAYLKSASYENYRAQLLRLRIRSRA